MSGQRDYPFPASPRQAQQYVGQRLFVECCQTFLPAIELHQDFAVDLDTGCLRRPGPSFIAGLIGLSLLYGGSDIAYTKPKNTILFLLAMTVICSASASPPRELVN